MLRRYIHIFEVLAQSPVGASIGRISGMSAGEYSHAQIKRTMGELVSDGFVSVEKVQYRPHIQSSIYRMTEKAREYFGYVVDKYDRHEQQHMLPLFSAASIDPVILSEMR